MILIHLIKSVRSSFLEMSPNLIGQSGFWTLVGDVLYKTLFKLMVIDVNVLLKKLEYCDKYCINLFLSFQKVKLAYYIDSLRTELNISSFYLL